MPLINFESVDPPTGDEEDLTDAYTTCQCPQPDDQYLMEVDAGSVMLRHAACRRPAAEWTDDGYSMDPIPVTLHWHATTDYWTNEVDAYGELTINGLPAATTEES
ncbi:hypothetical protein ACIOKA_37725 [Streptomyces anulatus]